MTVPLLPIGFELFWTHMITLKSITLTASMYSISIGISSRSKLFFAVTIMICIIFAYAFGIVTAIPPQMITEQMESNFNTCYQAAVLSIIFVFLAHTLERYYIHIEKRTPFPIFMEREEENGN
jgi:uncharacterized membrane protein YedE/YeeE